MNYRATLNSIEYPEYAEVAGAISHSEQSRLAIRLDTNALREFRNV